MADRLADGGVEILAPVVLNQVLASFGDDATTDAVIDAVQRDGTCWMGGTVWHGRHAMRISVSDSSTTEHDIDVSADAILRAWRSSPPESQRQGSTIGNIDWNVSRWSNTATSAAASPSHSIRPVSIAASIVVELVLSSSSTDRSSVATASAVPMQTRRLDEIARFDSITVQSPANGARAAEPEVHVAASPPTSSARNRTAIGVEQLLDRHRRQQARASSRRCVADVRSRSSCAPHRNALRNVADSLW